MYNAAAAPAGSCRAAVHFCKLWETQYSEDCKKEKIVILLKKKDSGGKRV